MPTHKINKLPQNTIEIDASIPWKELQEEKEKAFDQLHKDLAIEGFRKGKVPKELAKKHLKEEDLYNKALQQMIPQIYEEIVKKEKLQPIVAPQVQLASAKPNEDWEVKITTALAPEVDVSQYKEIIQKVKKEQKTGEIWTPGKEETKEQTEQKQSQKINMILQALVDGIQFEISDLVVEEEVKRRLSQLVDDVRKVGLGIDDYLKSRDLTMEKLKEQYSNEIKNTYKMEYILQKIAEKENITVEDKDMESFFEQLKDPKEQEMAKKNAYLYATILRKQKVLDYLSSL
jgi:trigger factor